MSAREKTLAYSAEGEVWLQFLLAKLQLLVTTHSRGIERISMLSSVLPACVIRDFFLSARDFRGVRVASSGEKTTDQSVV
jgi:hypothetical protein